jgi:hypothetical protein
MLRSLVNRQHVGIPRDYAEHDVKLLLEPIKETLTARGLVPAEPDASLARPPASPRIDISKLPNAAQLSLDASELKLQVAAPQCSDPQHAEIAVARSSAR